ncbi:MAG: CPBP family intramembrane metalloprotease [Lachnospiraceae bacterium]|nr:CPBP family intramembrane metalloprotease [Lachnospiraceae bacterium]
MVQKNIKHANLFWLFLIIVFIILQVVIGRMDLGIVPRIAILQGFIIVACFVYLKLDKRDIKETLHLQGFHIGSAFLVILLAICLSPVISLINAVSMLFVENAVTSTLSELTNIGLLPALLLVALTPAVAEELTFRGVLFGTYRKTDRLVSAVFVSALAFGLMHMNLNQFCYAFVLGIVMAVLVEITGSIFASSLLHFCFNGSSMVLYFVMKWLPDFMEKLMKDYPDQFTPQTKEMYETTIAQLRDTLSGNTVIQREQLVEAIYKYIPAAIVGLIFAVLLLIAIASLNNRTDNLKALIGKKTTAVAAAYPEDRAAKLVTVGYIISAIICVGMCVLAFFAEKLV